MLTRVYYVKGPDGRRIRFVQGVNRRERESKEMREEREAEEALQRKNAALGVRKWLQLEMQIRREAIMRQARAEQELRDEHRALLKRIAAKKAEIKKTNGRKRKFPGPEDAKTKSA